MKAITNKLLFFVALFCAFSLSARADWQITGDAVEQGTQAILVQNSNNSQEFVFVGKLNNQSFKITDGTKTYVHDCGDNDPLGELIPLREENAATDPGLRIRYVGLQDHFRVTLTVDGASKALKAELVEPAKQMYIMGGPFNNTEGSWELRDVVELEVDKDNPFVFYYKGDIRYNSLGDERGSLKFLKGRGWGENYHPDASGDVPLSQAIGKTLKMRLGGADNKWTIPADQSGDGYYEIKIDILNLTITVEEFVHNLSTFPRTVYIMGDAMPCGWTTANPMEMVKTGNGIFRWEGKVNEGPFKFVQRRGMWTRCYVATSEDVQLFTDNEYDAVYEEDYLSKGGNDYKFVITQAGEISLTLNLNTMKLAVGKPLTDIKTEDSDHGITFYSDSERLYLKSASAQPLQAYVFGIDGRAITRKRFSESTEIALPKGCYIIVLNEERGERIATIKTVIK